MTSLLRTPAISSSGISAQLIRLLPPLGCPGQPVWVPPNEVLRWEQLGFYRAPIPAGALELAWQPVAATAAATATAAIADPAGTIAVELLLNTRHAPPAAVTVDWGDGTTQTLPWPDTDGGGANGRLLHGYASRRNYTIQAALSGNGPAASVLVSLAGCPIWKPEVTPPTDCGGGGGSRWFNGDGPPITISGAVPGDYYLDGISGAFYLLED
jgi:hypothetical protein